MVLPYVSRDVFWPPKSLYSIYTGKETQGNTSETLYAIIFAFRDFYQQPKNSKSFGSNKHDVATQ